VLSVAGEGRSRPRVEAATPEFKGNALRHLLDLDDMSTGDVFDRKGRHGAPWAPVADGDDLPNGEVT
jgi:hypothetical protein